MTADIDFDINDTGGDDIPVISRVVPALRGDQAGSSASVRPVAVPVGAAAAAVTSATDSAVVAAKSEAAELADEEEIAAIKQRAGSEARPPAGPAVSGTSTAIFDEILKASGLKLDEAGQKRFSNLVDLYFRDLRDALETKSKLTMPAASGGLGLTDVEADQVMVGLTAKASGWRQLASEKMAKEKETFVAGQIAQAAAAETDEVQRDKTTLDSLFSRLTARSRRAPPVAGQQVPTTDHQPPITDQSAVPRIIPVIAAARPPLPSVGQPEKPITQPLPKNVVPLPSIPVPQPISVPPDAARKPAAPPPNLPVASVRPSIRPASQAESQITQPLPPPAADHEPLATSHEPPAEAKAVMSDVKFTPKLTGPVEELRSLTIKDFRRLSRDPHEATLKIRDKIDLLEEQSFEAKAAGVKAWQESEVNRLYLDLLRRSLEGKPVVEVIADKEAKGEQVLSKAEFDSCMDLNRKLRFG